MGGVEGIMGRGHHRREVHTHDSGSAAWSPGGPFLEVSDANLHVFFEKALRPLGAMSEDVAGAQRPDTR